MTVTGSAKQVLSFMTFKTYITLPVCYVAMYKLDMRETKHRTVNDVNLELLANSQRKLRFIERV